jgi:Spy/CpxP family protein refolding chaperone
MRLPTPRLLAALAAASLATWAAAQAPRPGPARTLNKAELLQNKSVQDELKITREQNRKLREVAREFEEAHRDEIARVRQEKDGRKGFELRRAALETMTRAMNDILTSEQIKRLGQIEIQAQGAGALVRSEVQKELNLSDRQREEIRSLADAGEKEVRETLKTPPADPKGWVEIGKKIRKIHQNTEERALAVLSDEQRKTWKEMTGEPFELKMALPPGQPERPRKDGGVP